MKTIKLTLWTDEPENRYSYTIKVQDKDYIKAKKVIEQANKNMPDIWTIKNNYLSSGSDEIDFLIYALDRANIKVDPLEVCFSWDVEEGNTTRQEYEKYLDSIRSKTKQGQRVQKLQKPKIIHLHLVPDNPENIYDISLAIEESQLPLAEKIIQELTDLNKIPNKNIISEDMGLSDELDIIENALNQAGINTLLHIPNEEIVIEEGNRSKSETDRFLSSLSKHSSKPKTGI